MIFPCSGMWICGARRNGKGRRKVIRVAEWKKISTCFDIDLIHIFSNMIICIIWCISLISHFYPLCLFSFIMTQCVFLCPEQWVGCVCVPELQSNERPRGLQVKRGNTNGIYLTLAVQKAALTEDNCMQKSTGSGSDCSIKAQIIAAEQQLKHVNVRANVRN